jgi:subtilase family serine protease/flagellar hook assembly protein FlgD
MTISMQAGWRWLTRALGRAVLPLACMGPGASFADAPVTDVFPNTGAFRATLQSANSNVAVIELAGGYNKVAPNGQLNVEPRTVVAREFYRHHADRYDFIVVFSKFEFDTGDAQAFYIGVRNDVRGLGIPVFDNSSYFGSNAKLQGYIDMAALSRYRLNPGDSRFEEVMRTLSHEFLHRWAAKVHFIDGNGQPSGALLGRDNAHWSFLLDTGGSVEYGNRWVDNGNGTFTSLPDRQFFSPLDLYLMGMLRRQEVPPSFYIHAPDVLAHRLPEAGVTISGQRRDVTIDQVIAAEGPRQPDADAAQKQFRIGFVLLTQPGTPATEQDIAQVNAVREAFETRLGALTGGRAMAHAFLEPRPIAAGTDPSISDPVLRPGNSANLQTATQWLRGRQQAQGDWSDSQLTRVRDTVVATRALGEVGNPDPSSTERAVTWLGTQVTSNNDYAARRISALAARATEADWVQLVAAQNPDGGWGAAAGYQSSPLDTALVVQALSSDPNAARRTAASNAARAFLVSKQNADGGWSHAVNGVSRTFTTSQAMRALAMLSANPQVAAAARFLATRQNADGGFGDSPSTTHDTSNVLLALSASRQLGAVRTLDGFRFLDATQQPDGSWDGSVYATALAIHTLGTAQTYNWVLSSVVASPGSVTEGYPVTVDVPVANNSTVVAPATTVALYIGDATGSPVAEIPVPPLQPGASITVRGTVPTSNRTGNQLLTAVADPASLGSEMSRSDNQAAVHLLVSPAPAQPDLVVFGSDVQAMPAVVSWLPTPVSVVSRVSNLGTSDVLGARVRLLAGASLDTLSVVDERTVNVMGRATVPVTNTLQVTRPGRQVLVVEVVMPSGQTESRTDNNQAQTQVETASSFDPAVQASGLSVTPAQQVMLGAEATLRALVRNHGTSDTPPFDVVLSVASGSTVREIGRSTVQLEAAGERSIVLPWTPDVTGPVQFRVQLDPANAVSDMDRTNNSASLGFTALDPATQLADLTVVSNSVTVQPAQLTRLPTNGSVTAQLSNIGAVAATGVRAILLMGTSVDNLVQVGDRTVDLASGSTVPVEIPFVVTTPGRYFFSVYVDPDAAIPDRDRANNRTNVTMEMVDVVDVGVSANEVSVPAQPVMFGTNADFVATVRNHGTIEAQAFSVVFHVVSGAERHEVGRSVVTVPPGAERQVTASWTADLAGALQLQVSLDPAGTLSDANLANNIVERAFAGGAPAPNLLIAVPGVTLTPSQPLEGRPLGLSALVRNAGQLPASDIQVGFYDGDPSTGGALLAPLQTIPALAAGQAVPVSVQVPNLTVSGMRTFHVVVDPANHIAEHLESDNTARLQTTVSTMPDLAVSTESMSLSPSSPRPGDALTVVAGVTNFGQQPAEQVLVRLLDGDAVVAEQIIPSMAGLGQSSATFRYTLPASQTARSLSVQVDPSNAIAESDESNNVAARRLNVHTGTAFVSETYFSPNGDGVKDSTSFSFRLDAPAIVRVQAVDESDQVVRSFAGLGPGAVGDGSVVWDGRDDFGRIVTDGVYRLRATSTAGVLVAEADTVVDNNRTPVLLASGTPAEFYRNVSCTLPNFETWTSTLDEQSMFFLGNDLGGAGIYRASLLGEASTTVVANADAASGGGTLRHLSVSARGDVVAYGRINPHEAGDGWLPNEIWTVQGDGTARARIASPTSPIFGRELRRVDDLSLAHDGRSVVALVRWRDCASPSMSACGVVRLPVAQGGSPQQLFQAPGIDGWAVAPNRRKAVLRLYDEATGRLDLVVLDFETGTFTAAPAGLYSSGVAGATMVKWSPDSSRFLVYGSVRDMGVDVDNTIDFQFDVFDANFNLDQRFRTDKGPGDESWYSGLISNVEWSSAGDEFVFMLEPRPYGEWYGGGVEASDYASSPSMYRASLPRRSLMQVPVDRQQLTNLRGNSQVLWAPFSRSLVKVDPSTSQYVSVHADRGQVAGLFPSWWSPGMGPAGMSMQPTQFAPSGRRLYFISDRDRLDNRSACYAPHSAQQLFAYESLHNLLADFQPLQDPRAGGISMRGTAADLNFARYLLHYADVRSPSEWHDVSLPVHEQRIGEVLGVWVPPAPGTYLVRLTVEDRAGNSAAAVRRVTWTETSPVSSVIKNFDYISPNGDGVQDALRLTYRVNVAGNLSLEVRREDGSRVRLIAINHAAPVASATAEWDGRDDQGRVVPDGKYLVRLLDYEVQVEVDTTPPRIEMTGASEHAFNFKVPPVPEVIEFIGDALKGTVSPLQFRVQPQERLVATIRDASDIVIREIEFGAGTHDFVWDGLDYGNQPMPAGTYQLSFSSARPMDLGGGAFPHFTLEFRRGQAGLSSTTSVIFQMVDEDGDGHIDLAPLFAGRVSDRLLQEDEVTIEYGWGHPPTDWNVASKGIHKQSMPSGLSIADVRFAEDAHGVPTATYQGRHAGRGVSGLHIRASARDKAGNTASSMVSYRDFEEVVQTADQAGWIAYGSRQLDERGIVSSTTFNPRITTVRSCPAAVEDFCTMESANLAFVDSLRGTVVSTDFRYFFVPEIAGYVLGVPTKHYPVVLPLPENLSSLNWTTVPLRNANGAVPAQGIADVQLEPHAIAFRWTPPRQEAGYWLYQLVVRDENGQEIRSSVHHIARTGDALQAAAKWTAWHEPALECGAAPTEIAHVRLEVTFPDSDPAAVARRQLSGKRLLRVNTDGTGTVVYEDLVLSGGGDLNFSASFSTASWAVGRHDFVAEIRPAGQPNWIRVAQPYLYVNHVAPQVLVETLPRMCAAREAVVNVGTLPYVPLNIEIREPYATYHDAQLQSPDLSWTTRGPIGVPTTADDLPPGIDVQATKLPNTVGVNPVYCSLPGGCRNSGPIVWPRRQGIFRHASEVRLYGAEPEGQEGVRPIPFSGDITARVRAYGSSGHLSCAPVRLNLDGSVEATAGIDRHLFSPNGDGFLDIVSASLTAFEDVTARVEVVSAFRRADGTLAAGDQLVAELANNLALSAGSGDRLVPWDGRTTAGSVAPDGLYALRVSFTDTCGNVRVELLDAEVDNTPPAIVVTEPRPNTEAPLDLIVRGSVTDLHPGHYEVDGVTGGVPTRLPSIGPMNRSQVMLAQWNTAGLSGAGGIAVRAVDAVGNRSELQVPLALNGAVDLVASLRALPDPISPNGDGRRESVTLLYTLSNAAHVSVAVQSEATGAVVANLAIAQPRPAGDGSLVWNGRGTTGLVEPDGRYVAVLTAEVVSNGSVVTHQTVRTSFQLDATPPTISYTLPRGPVTTGAGGVVSRAADPLLTHATLEISVSGAAFTAMAETHAGTGELSAPLDHVPEGPIRLRVQAEDLAENRSSSLLDVIIDRTPPLPRITSPPANAYVSGLRGPYSLDGSIEELNLASWQLRLGTTVLREGTSLPAPGRLLHWDPLTVADGPYTLTLQALDLANLTGTASVNFTVDNTPPVVQIHAAGSPVYLKLGSVLRGSATDLNLENYRVDIAPGGSARWSEVGRGTTEVRDAPLTTLSVLPADGTYGLRLTAVDKAGNESSTVQEVVVDTTAPQSVVLTAELRNRRDADVRWVVASEPDAAGYILFRNGSRLNTALLTTTSYLDVGLPGGTYVYTVKVVDHAGNESDPSNEGRVVVTTTEPVAQIFAPTQNAYAAGLMDVRGTASAPADFREYRLFIGTGAAPTSWELLRRSPVAITANTLSAWNTLSLAEGSLYTLRLEAEDLSGAIATDRVTVRVKNTPPRAPIHLQGTLVGNDIPLTWTPNTEPDLQGYLLYRNQRLVNASGLVIGSLVPYLIRPAAYDDRQLPDGVYRYVVYAMDMAGNISPPSNEVEFLIDNQPPHVPVVRPATESSVGESVTLVGESPDTDIATVQFQYKPVASQAWVNVGAPQTANAGPWRVEWITTGLPHGRYDVRAVATDLGGRVDPNPGGIVLVLTDLRKPDPATTLTTRVTGGDVALNWVSSPSTYAVGYHIDRVNPDASLSRLTTEPIAALTYTDTGLADATYTYRVYAVSAGGTLADPSNDSRAVVFTPGYTQPYTPTTDAATVLEGTTLPAHRVMLRTSAGTAVAETPSAANGSFRFASVTLSQGDNRFVLVAGDDQGNTSKPAPWHAVRGLAPAAPTGLVATVSGRQVALSWAANTEADLEGYVPALSGVLLAGTAVPSGVSASSVYPSWGDFYAADRVLDADAYSGWRPTYEQPAAGQWLEVQLGEARNIESVSLAWAESAVPLRYRIEGHDGEVWVPLAQIQATTPEAILDIRLARSYRTDRLRVLVQEALDENVQLNSLALTALARTPLRSASFEGLPEGYARTGVAAVTALGFVGPVAEATPPVGDVTPPDAPVLQAQAVVSDAHLSWIGPSNLDVAGFRLWRDGQLIATLMNPSARSHVDPSLPNAHYDYVVAAVDTAGNVSLPSNIAGVDINVGGPNAPITAAASAPAGGGLVVVSWTVAPGPQPSSFLLARSMTPGGPYTTIATRVPASPYDDRAVQNGVRYYYRVTGLDLAGNTGNMSNEADALPFDRQPPGVPYFVLPSRAPGPVVTEQGRSTLVGIADPGSLVVVTRDDERVNTVPAAAQAQELVLQDGRGNVFDLSLDGSLLYFYQNGNAVQRDDGTPVPSASLSMAGVEAFRFAPDGRSAAVLRYSNSTGSLSLMRWDRATDSVSSVSTIVQGGLLAFSPDGRTLAARAYDNLTARSGVVLIDWANGGTRFIEGQFEHGAWSPNSRTLALATSSSLRLIDTQAASDVVVPAVQFPGSVSWVHDGSALLVDTGVVSGSDRVISRVAVPSLAVSVIASEPGVSFTRPVASPDSDAYLALRNGVLVKRGPVGQLEVVAAQALDYQAPIWAGSHTIVYQPSWNSLVVRRPAGRFVLAEAALAPGSNFFGAVAVDATGNTSPPAAELEIQRIVPDLPDWAVTNESWTVLPATPQSGELTTIGLRVRNLGAAAPATRISLSVVDQQGTVRPVAEAALPAMAPGIEHVVRAFWTPSQPGRYTLMAVIDAAGTVQERSKDNNQAAFDLFVSGTVSGGPELQARTDKARYTAGERVTADVAALSTGATFSGDLITRIVDGSGAEVARFEARAVRDLTYGRPQSFVYNWPTGTTFSGDYRVVAQLLDVQGLPAAQASAAFAIEGATTFGANIVTDRAQYVQGDTVTARGTVRYLSGNLPVADIGAVMSIRSASGEVLASRAFNLQGVLQGSQADVDMEWPAGAVGPYTARLVVGDPTLPAAMAETVFAVVPPGTPLIVGRLHVAGDVFLTSEPISTTSAVANQGAPLDPLPVRIRALDVAGQELAAWSGQLTGLGATPVVTPALLAGSWPLATFELRLEAQVAGNWTTLDRARVRAAERTPPRVQFIAPAPAAVVRSTATVSVLATPRQAPVALVQMLPGSGAWVTMAPQGGSGAYFSNALPAQDGPVRLQARAADTLGNVSTPATLDIVIDNTPPLITVTGVTDQQVSPTVLTPVVSVTDLHLASYTMTLNGVPFVSGTPVGTGEHLLSISAVDLADNRSSRTLQFTVRPALRVGGALDVPAVVMVGDVAALNYTVQNIGDVAFTSLPVTLRVREQGSGTLRAAFPLNATLEVGQAQAGTVNWSAAAPVGQMTVTLSATVNGIEQLLAEAPMRVDAPVEAVSLSASARVAADARVLVFMACRTYGVDDPACLQQRLAAVTTQLHLSGTPYRVVATAAEFEAEMRCGTYNAYWLSGTLHLLAYDTYRELREAARRGDGVFLDGEQPWEGEEIRQVTGTYKYDWFEEEDKTAEMLPNLGFQAGPLPTLGRPARFVLADGELLATFDNFFVAAARHRFELGGSTLMAFEFAGMLAAPGGTADSRLLALLDGTVRHMAFAPTVLTLGDAVRLSTEVRNTGTQAVDVEARATLPEGVGYMDAQPTAAQVIPASPGAPAQVVWQFRLEPGAVADLRLRVRLDTESPAALQVPVAVYNRPVSGVPELRTTANHSVPVAQGLALSIAARDLVLGLAPTDANEQAALSYAQTAAGFALQNFQDGDYQAALSKWLNVASLIGSMTSDDPLKLAAARQAVAMAAEAATDRLCRP